MQMKSQVDSERKDCVSGDPYRSGRTRPISVPLHSFAKPGRGKHDFGDVAEGKLTIEDVLNLIAAATTKAVPVGLTIAEHLPWDMLNLKNMLSELPLLK